MNNLNTISVKSNAEVLKNVESVDIMALNAITHTLDLIEKILKEKVAYAPNILPSIIAFLDAARPVFIEGDRLTKLNARKPELITVNECDRPEDIVIAGTVRQLFEDEDSGLSMDKQQAVKALVTTEDAVFPEAVTIHTLDSIVQRYVNSGITRQLFIQNHGSDFEPEITDMLYPKVNGIATEDMNYADSVGDKIRNTVSYWVNATEELDRLARELGGHNEYLNKYRGLTAFLTEYNATGMSNGYLSDEISRIEEQGGAHIINKYREVIDNIEKEGSVDSIIQSASELFEYLNGLENIEQFHWLKQIHYWLYHMHVANMPEEQAERKRIKSMIDDQLTILAERPEVEQKFRISVSEAAEYESETTEGESETTKDEVANLLSAKPTESASSTDLEDYISRVYSLSSSLQFCINSANSIKAKIIDAPYSASVDSMLQTLKPSIEKWSEYLYGAILAQLPDEYDQWQREVADVAAKAKAATTGETGQAVINAAKRLQEAYDQLSVKS